MGGTLQVPYGTVAGIFTRSGQLTDVLPPGNHAVLPQTLPGLARMTRMNATAGAVVPAAAFLLNMAPVTEVPWSLDLFLTQGQRGGHYVTSLEGRFGLQVTDPPRCLAGLVGGAKQVAGAQTEPMQSFRLATGGKFHVDHLPELASYFVRGRIADLVRQAMVQLNLPLEALPRAGRELEAAAGPSAAVWMNGIGMNLSRLEVGPVRAPMRAPCAGCGSPTAATAPAQFRRNISLLHIRFEKQVEGNFCAPCAAKTALGYNGIMLVCGWWGIIGMVLSPIYFVSNIYNLGRHATSPKTPSEGGDPSFHTFS